MFYCSVLWQFFGVVAYNAKHFSALLPTTQKKVPRCCLQRQSFFRVVGNNTEKCSNFSLCVFFYIVADNAVYFSALYTATRKNYLCCCLQYGKMVSIVGNNVEKCSNLIISTNLKPYANLHQGFNQRPRMMCFMKKSLGENLAGLSL